MLQAMSTAATGMQAQETQIQVISNNLANASTPGFKVSRAHFQDLLYVNERQAGTQSSQTSFVPTGSSIGLGSKTASVDQIFHRRPARQHRQSARRRDPGQRIFPGLDAGWIDCLYPRRQFPD